MRIKVGDDILDAYKDEVIAQNYAVNRIGEITTRQGSYSNAFTIPLTAKNRRVLEYPDNINANSRKPYQKVSATLIDNGVPIATGYLRYNLTTDNNLQCSFFATNVEWFSLIKNKKLTDIDLSEFDHDWTVQNIATAINADKDSGYTYPLIDYGECGSVSPVSGFIDVTGDQMFPAMFVHTIVEKMFFDVGWKVEGEMIDHPLYKRMIIPFSAKSFNQSEAFIEENSQSFTLPSGDQAFSDSFPVNATTNFSFDVVWESPATSVLNIITAAGSYNINVIIDLEVVHTSTPPNDFDLTAKAVMILINSVEVASTASVPLSPTWDADLTNQHVLDYTAILEIGDTIEIRVMDGTAIVAATAGGPVELDVTVLEENTSLVIAPSSEEIAYGAPITIANTLPDITQEDFLKYLVFLFGAIPQANNNSKTINFSLFRSIKNNIPDALDWSNKIDLSKSRETDFTELLQNYGQVSILTYAEDENDAELSAYEAETGKRLGEGQFDIENEHLAARQVIYEAPFSSMININSFDDTLYIPQIRFKAQTVNDSDVEPVPKIAILSENISISTLSGGLFSLLDMENPNNVSDNEQVSSLPFCWFVKTSYISQINALRDSLVFDQAVFTNVEGEPIIPRFLQDYEDIFNSVRYVKAYFHLTEIDISDLDFSVPVFVDKYKSYFYISRINEYRGSGETVECELVKISKSVEALQVLTPDNVFIDNDLQEFIDSDGEAFFDGP